MVDRVVASAQEMARGLPEPIVRQIAAALIADHQLDRERAGQIIRDGSPSAQHRRLTNNLMGAWRDGAPELSAAAVGGMLLATERTTGPANDLSLVWTGPGVLGVPVRRTDQALIEVIDGAQKELSIVSFVAYRVPLVRDAVACAAARGVYVRVVLESPDESAGRVAWSGVGEVADRTGRIEFFVWPRGRRPADDSGRSGSLHAKFAVADSTKLFVSSANLTEYALSLNMEMGILIEGGELPRMAQELVDGLIRAGKLVRN
jgi:phosphatidylserine/phosphatidylglycerophosphate/cardiolipin synthase-like enzyme